mmetsp:Transcript_71515/g.190974  ORF Transcript_71515/g.190974 Transcript_71515/m.190974 type:complete len:155 (-) Transcript_71515:416-880(-)
MMPIPANDPLLSPAVNKEDGTWFSSFFRRQSNSGKGSRNHNICEVFAKWSAGMWWFAEISMQLDKKNIAEYRAYSGSSQSTRIEQYDSLHRIDKTQREECENLAPLLADDANREYYMRCLQAKTLQKYLSNHAVPISSTEIRGGKCKWYDTTSI